MPRRILLFVTDLEIGGTPTVVRELATRLHDPPRVEVEVACLKEWGPVADQIRAAGIEVTAFGVTSPLQLPRAVGRLRQLVRERGIDTVFSFLVHANTVAAIASRKLEDVRFVQSIQTTQSRPKWHWWLQSIVHQAAEAVVVPSPSTADVAHTRSGIPREKIVVIPNAIDPDTFERSPVPAANPRPYPIGFIGRLDPVKKIDWLLSEIKGVDHVTRGNVHLHVFGDGPMRDNIRGRIAELGLRHIVTMHGAVGRPQEALPWVGLLVLRSAAEGFGLVLIEAMAAGVPVVATDVPGIRDVVRHGETGMLVPFASSAEMIMTIARLIDDVPLRERLIANGLAEVRARFSWQSVLPQYRRVLGLVPSPHVGAGQGMNAE